MDAERAMTALGYVDAWRVLVSDVQSARREAVEAACAVRGPTNVARSLGISRTAVAGLRRDPGASRPRRVKRGTDAATTGGGLRVTDPDGSLGAYADAVARLAAHAYGHATAPDPTEGPGAVVER